MIMEFCQKDLWKSLNIDDGIKTIDSHTGGELTRLVVGGIGDIQGSSMALKREYFQKEYDHIRQILTKEPRGHKGGLAAVVTENVTADASFGLIYMDARRYPYLCGHATIGAVVTLAKTGFLDLKEGENRITVDTPSGTMHTIASVAQGQVKSVAIDMVPSFVLETDRRIDVPGFGTLSIDLVCVGGFFAMVSSQQTGIEPVLVNSQILAKLGMKIIQAANEQVEVFHPERPEVTTVDVAEFYAAHHENMREGKSVVVYGESHIDRSPCGTGTAAKLTLLHHAKKIDLHQTYTNYSPLGTSFDAKLVKTLKVGSLDAVVARVSGMAHITGVHAFLLEESDPFPQGFLLS
jgi:proline racemase